MFNILDESVNIIDVVTETYSDEDMFDEIDTEKYTLDELNKLYPVEFIKKYKRADDSYVDNVAYMTSYGYIILYYDESGNYVFGNDIIVEKSLKEFDVLNVGDSIDDVQKFDENGEFLFLYTGIDAPKISQHYTIDGYMVMIHYNSDYSVTEIENRLI
ncbi:MAG: hypothetical protein K2K14_03315 [Ruminococcus sp.]|nr:hypothetical protein [Ruminococcus sp.]